MSNYSAVAMEILIDAYTSALDEAERRVSEHWSKDEVWVIARFATIPLSEELAKLKAEYACVQAQTTS